MFGSSGFAAAFYTFACSSTSALGSTHTPSKRMLSQAERFPPQSKWPSEEFRHYETHLTRSQLVGFRRLVRERCGEKAIDEYIRENPAIFTVALSFANTGHHGTWVIPQQVIQPAIKGVAPGLIPDYLLGGKSSDGFEWWIAELKGVDAPIFTKRRGAMAFSSVTNHGICQLLNYMDFCAENQATLRSQFRLFGLREPRGMLFVGREADIASEAEFEKLKAAWNLLSHSKLQIRTYDSLLRAFERMFEFNERSRHERRDRNRRAGA